MHGKILTLLLLLLLISSVFAYVKPSFPGQPIIVSSGSDFYGSSEGIVTIDLNLDVVNTNFKDFFIRITGLDDTSTIVKEVSFNKEKIETTSYPVYETSKTKISQKLLNKTPLEITLIFDPEEIGFARKFNIELVDKDGIIIADLDPFLSGWDYRLPLTVTSDGAYSFLTQQILFNSTKLGDNNAHFWANTQNDGDDVRFTKSDNTLLEINNSSWVDNSNASFLVSFDSLVSGDNNFYVYYGNSGATADNNTSLALDLAYTVFDDFSDGDYTNDPTWTVNSGTFDASSGYLSTSAESRIRVGLPSTITDGNLGTNTYAWKLDYYTASDNTAHYFFLASPNTDFSGNTWQIIIHDLDSKIYLYKNGTTDIVIQPTFNFTAGNYHNIIIKRTPSDCNWSIFVNDNIIGSGIDCEDPSGHSIMGTGRSGANNGSEVRIDNIEIGKLVSLTYTFAGYESGGVTWNDFKIVDYINKGEIDLNVSTNTKINLDVNLTLASFNVNDVNTYFQVRNYYDDTNCFRWIRNTNYCGFQEDTSSYSTVSSSDDTYYIRSSDYADSFYKYSNYNVNPANYSSLDGNYVFNSSDDWAKMFFNNVRLTGLPDSNMFVEYMFGGSFVGATNRNLIIYDCNYDSLNPVGDTSCYSFTFSPDTEVERDGYLQLDYTTDDSNSFEGVKLNEDGNHFVYFNCPNCTPSQYWNLSYIDENTNLDRTRNYESATGVSNLVASTKTFNSHFHVNSFLADSNLEYYLSVTDNNSIYASPIQTESIEIVNIKPFINSFDFPLQNTRYFGLVDINVTVEDPNNNVLTCDLNINGAGVSYSIATDVNVVSNKCGYTFDSGVYSDGNYYVSVAVKETDTTEMFITLGSADYNFFIDNNAPVLTVVYPNGNEYFLDPATITIDFNVSDAYPEILIDLNYSSSNSQGTGTPLLLSESINGAIILCSGIECSYTWNTSGVSDGNYYILIDASDGLYNSFDASDSDFNIYSAGTTPATNESDYSNRYINPESNQRDDNRYYNPDSAFNLDEDEKQTAELKQMNNFLFYFGLIIIVIVIILGVVLWKKR